jgi:hypothetical protein
VGASQKLGGYGGGLFIDVFGPVGELADVVYVNVQGFLFPE